MRDKYDQGMALFRERNYGGALAVFSALLEEFPKHLGSVRMRALCMQSLGKHHEVIEDCSRAIELEPTRSESYPYIFYLRIYRGINLARLGKHPEAIEDYQQAIAIAPHEAAIYYLQAKSSKAGSPAEANELYKRDIGTHFYDDVSGAHVAAAHRLWEIGESDAAIHVCGMAIEEDPDCLEAYIARAGAYLNSNKYALAAADYGYMASKEWRKPWAHMQCGLCKQKLGHYHEAIEDLNEAIASRSTALSSQDLALAYRLRGLCRQELEEYSDAIKDFEDAIAEQKTATDEGSEAAIAKQKTAEDYLNLAYCNVISVCDDISADHKARLLAYEEAIKDCIEAIKLNPKYALAYRDLGFYYSQLGRHSEAIKAYEQVVGLKPSDATAYYHMAESNCNIGKFEQAVEQYGKSIEIYKDMGTHTKQALHRYYSAYLHRGICYRNNKRKDLAIKDYKEAIKLLPDEPRAYHNLAQVSIDSEEFQKAYDLSRKAYDLSRQASDSDMADTAKPLIDWLKRKCAAKGITLLEDRAVSRLTAAGLFARPLSTSAAAASVSSAAAASVSSAAAASASSAAP